MREKSKFIGFLLSAVPGLAHLYIGLKERAIIFFMIFSGLLFGSIGLTVLASDDAFLLLFVFAYPLIWLISIVDLFTAWKSIQMRELYNNGSINEVQEEHKFNKKTVTLALSIIPGAGHMFLGYQEKGLIIMGAFFFSIFFMGWLGISLLLFLLPLIWFYSFFDAMHIVDGTKEVERHEELKLPKVKPEWVGYTLIGIGVVIILERILYPLIDWHIRRYIQTSIVSLIFIVLGVYILMKNKKSINENQVVDNDEE